MWNTRFAWRICGKRCLGTLWIHTICDSAVWFMRFVRLKKVVVSFPFSRDPFLFIFSMSFFFKDCTLHNISIFRCLLRNFPEFLMLNAHSTDHLFLRKEKKHEICVDIDACIITTFEPTVSSWRWRTNAIFNEFEMMV